MHPLRRRPDAGPLASCPPSPARPRGRASAPPRAAHPGAGQGLPASRDPSETAFRALYERYKDRVYLACLRRTGNANDALDASQETFLRIFANLCRFRGHSLARWVHVIAVNASRDVCRKGDRRDRVSLEALLERRAPGRPEGRAIDERCPSPELACARHELEATVEGALAHLSAPLREAALLRYVQGLAYEDVAEALRLPIGTVKSRLARAHEVLKLRLEPKLAAHEVG